MGPVAKTGSSIPVGVVTGMGSRRKDWFVGSGWGGWRR